jgi:Zn-dependent membrane protease YugP
MTGYGDFYVYMGIAFVLSLIGGTISSRLKSKFQKYSRQSLGSRMSGSEIARAMLDDYGIRDVQIVKGSGFLTDHYNPLNKTVSLSPPVFEGRNIAAAAVAAHECGHAVQHAKAYPLLQMRSSLVPVVQIASSAMQWILLLAFITLNSMPQIMLLAIVAFGLTTLFSFVTLPVEFDASKRALAWLDKAEMTTPSEHSAAQDALKWAAMTYVAAALSSLVMLAYLVLRYLGASSDD